MARIDLNTPRPLRIDRSMDGFVTGAIDMAATKALQKRLMYAHLVCMGLFVTVLLAIPAWLFALANILMSPKLAYQRIEVNARGVRLQHLLSRGELTVGEVVDGQSGGSRLLGWGQPPTPSVIAFTDIKRVDWTEHSIRIDCIDGTTQTIDLQLTSRDDIERLGNAILEAWENAGGDVPLDDSERAASERARRQLEGMTRGRS